MMTVDGKRPLVGIVLTVEECFLQCGKALLRSELWSQREHATLLATFAQMLRIMARLETRWK